MAVIDYEAVMSSHIIRPLTSKDRTFINDQLIPFTIR